MGIIIQKLIFILEIEHKETVITKVKTIIIIKIDKIMNIVKMIMKWPEETKIIIKVEEDKDKDNKTTGDHMTGILIEAKKGNFTKIMIIVTIIIIIIDKIMILIKIIIKRPE